MFRRIALGVLVKSATFFRQNIIGKMLKIMPNVVMLTYKAWKGVILADV